MKKRFLVFVLTLLSGVTFGQNSTEANNLVEEGIVYHDKGDYENALIKYDKALEADKDNLFALTEKAMTLNAAGKYALAIECCEKAFKRHSVDNGFKTLYVCYGNAYDGLKKPEESVKIYNKGIKDFPNYYQLYYNKGVTLAGMNKIDEAIMSFEKSVSLNPNHPGSHNALGRLSDNSETRVRALLAYYRFMVLEPKSSRGAENLSYIKRIMTANAEKKGENEITLQLDSNILKGFDGKQKENSFKSTDLILSMDAALDYDDKYKNETQIERFIRKTGTFFSSLEESKKDNYGFYWDYYVPYFTEMKAKGLIEPFAYIAFSGSKDEVVQAWLNSHKNDVAKFYDWNKAFNWKGK
ncbi:hypothetical protein FCR2A7T_20890 [Flavobacterium cauense R2A-7]|uniref:Tfp pilus assembly protein PilF n=1 Tax=Flavobacterium cauense R2A-7 TaxID=1341154 RepID=V6RXD4_9FLAO|nr:hypothetical protein [Flavobacterium cauense]ESU18687.1 hypothetical protein FCR2A7T_20890 [Flavobacterium cauense R2A-7]KGO81836.1 hypothetical protein Q762_08320 [Flavobacterium cauense R2A-7]TWI13869.1 Tfp pilus assembly protein PilF [Flavobacterium cauense R2A-7]